MPEKAKLKWWLVTNSKNWISDIEADRISKDVSGNTLFWIGEELVASVPGEYLVTLKVGGKDED